MPKISEKLEDFEGHKFARLRVTNIIETQHYGNMGRSKRVAKCLCDCGGFTWCTVSELKIKKRVSCGCQLKERAGLLNRKETGEAALTVAFHWKKSYAKNKNFEFHLTKKEFEILSIQNCFYCNAPPANVCRARCNNGDFTYNGIDRVNNLLGYVIDNCVTCCLKCNRMKSDMSISDFIQRCRIILERYDNNRAVGKGSDF